MWSAPKTKTLSGDSSVIRFRFWKIASTEPLYQLSPVRICAGTVSQNCERKLVMRQCRETCLLSESDLYWVRILILKMSLLTKFDRQKSMMR